MFAHEWNRALHANVPWQEAYATVEREARQVLSFHGSLFAGETLTTDELVETLYKEADARGDGILARKRIYKALLALATHGLADCATRGEERALKHNRNKIIRPWLWHAPKAPEVKKCPHCQGELP